MESDGNNRHTWKAVAISLVSMAVITLLLLFALAKWIDRYARHAEYITVPQITGMDESEAAEVLSASSLTYRIEEYRYDAGSGEGQIIAQRPKAGSAVKAERIIYVTVNSGKIPMKAIPDVADNSSLRETVSKLTAAGFRLTEHEYIPGDKDWVYEIRLGNTVIPNGKEVPEGSLLTIVVGNGGEETEDEEMTQGQPDPDFFGN